MYQSALVRKAKCNPPPPTFDSQSFSLFFFFSCFLTLTPSSQFPFRTLWSWDALLNQIRKRKLLSLCHSSSSISSQIASWRAAPVVAPSHKPQRLSENRLETPLTVFMNFSLCLVFVVFLNVQRCSMFCVHCAHYMFSLWFHIRV